MLIEHSEEGQRIKTFAEDKAVVVSDWNAFCKDLQHSMGGVAVPVRNRPVGVLTRELGSRAQRGKMGDEGMQLWETAQCDPKSGAAA